MSSFGARDVASRRQVALERFHRGLGNAVPLQAPDRSGASIQVEREGNIDGFCGCVDRAFVAKSLNAMEARGLLKRA